MHAYVAADSSNYNSVVDHQLVFFIRMYINLWMV